ncbi:hypothetical protein AAZX31_08G308300 [Glycine max]
MESAFFCYRFRVLNAEAQRAVMEEFELPYRAVSNVEFEVVTYQPLSLVQTSIWCQFFQDIEIIEQID